MPESRVRIPSEDPELDDLMHPWICDRSLAAADLLIAQFVEKDAFLRAIIIGQQERLCANEDEMATYDDEEAAMKKQIADLQAQLAKLQPAPAPSK